VFYYYKLPYSCFRSNCLKRNQAEESQSKRKIKKIKNYTDQVSAMAANLASSGSFREELEEIEVRLTIFVSVLGLSGNEGSIGTG